MRPLLLAVTLATASLCFAPVARATSVIPPTLDELVAHAHSVVRTRVVSQRCEWRGVGDDRYIVTIVTFTVDETILGPEQPALELEFFGGELDGERMAVAGQSRFVEGREDILFVSRERSALTPLVRMMYGRYLVATTREGRRFVARDNGTPLASTDDVATTMTARPPAMMLAQIEAGRLVDPDAFAESVRQAAARLADEGGGTR